ncbi:MAG TPA: exopolyphosphatase [Vicinamibacteria bacterium]|nr:exopolyphosphatase [Vicinamibacteria bacterium]
MRLVTRADLDGLTCAVLLGSCETVDAIELVNPQDVADRRFSVGPEDILANLPYHPGCGLWFDNHQITDPRAMPPSGFRGRYGVAPSAARVVYGEYLPRHPDLARYERLVAETDRLDSAQLSLSDVVSPEGYVLLGFTLDARTGFGNLREYFLQLLPAVRDLPLAQVLELPEVRERARLMREQDQRFREVALAHSRLDHNVVVTDFRGVTPLPIGNRFLIFTLFPGANVAVRLQRGLQPGTVSLSAGRSIFDRSCHANLAVLLSLHGGGGHAGAAACVVPEGQADSRLAEIVAALKRNA